MIVILITIEIELTALESPTSSLSSAVNAGDEEAIGLKNRITSV